MKKSFENDCVTLLSQSIREHALLSHSMIVDVQNNEQLSVTNFTKLDKAQLSILNINRSSNILSTLFGFTRDESHLLYQPFVIEEILHNMCETLSTVLSSIPNLSITYSLSLEDEFSTAVIEHSRFDLIIFNIIHYCLKDTFLNSEDIRKIEIRASETLHNFVFSIYDFDSKPIDNPFDLLAFNNKAPSAYDDSFSNAANLGAVSLIVAKRLATLSKYRIQYKHLKNTNRYSIIVPKKVSAGTVYSGTTHYNSTYETDKTRLLETFSDILLNFCEEY